METKKRDWLIKKRIDRHLKPEDIAELVGVTQQFYNYVENGKRRPSPETAIKIGKVLDFDWKVFYEKRKYEQQSQN